MITEVISSFPQQFKYEPHLKQASKLRHWARVVVVGMGGSHLAADLLRVVKPELSVVVHSDYGLPWLAPRLRRQTLVILSSYSGNTEEVVQAFYETRQQKVAALIIASGGTLLELAHEYGVPYIQLPLNELQPRLALGFSFRALLKALGERQLLRESEQLAECLESVKAQTAGRRLARRLEGVVPLVYTSTRNWPVAYNWKIKLNETAKIPAFANVLPELNHNEMTGFDVAPTTRALSSRFHFVLLTDSEDGAALTKRWRLLEQLLHKRWLAVERVPLVGASRLEKIFSSLMVADWTALALAEHYGVEAEQVPMVEEFKRQLAGGIDF